MKYFIKAVLEKAPFFGITYRVASNKIFLTFDDGPHPVHTKKILNTLRDYEVQASFFLLGKNIERYPYLIKQMLEEKHSIGYHTYDHKRIDKMDLRSLKREIERMQDIFSRFTNTQVKLFRPPYGALSITAFLYLWIKRIRIIQWSIDSKDSFGLSEKTVHNILRNCSLKGGEIILFHDDNPCANKILPWIIQTIRSKNMEFGTF